MDGMGSLHIFKGKISPFRKSAYLYTNNGKESDLFIQEGMGVDEFMDNVPFTKKQLKDLNNGYPIYVQKHLMDDYFMN